MSLKQEFDLKEIDKTNFICLKFPDSSLYYGEMAYFSAENVLITEE